MERTDIETPRPGLILAATISAAILVVANVSSLNVALPQLSRSLGASQTDVHWMIDIYAVFLAALLLPAGALGDRFGRRRMLLLGVLVVAAANAATLFVDTAMPVIVLRAVSGVGAAFVFPATLSTITSTLPADQRSKGVAMWTAAVGIGGIFGVMGSGLLIESFWWGSVFLAMSLAALVVFAICWFFVPDSSDPEEANLDPVGAVLSFIAAGALVLGVIEGPVKGWTSTLALAGLTIGGVAMVAFVAWERRNPRPLLDVRLFAERGVRSGALSIFVQFTAAFGFFFLTVPYLAFVLGFGPLKTGLGLMPVALGLFPGAAAAVPLTRHFGRKAVGAVGLLILASGFVLGTTIEINSDFIWFAAVMAVFGLGLGLAGPPATEAIVEALPAAKQGVASALNDVLREFGAAIGIAIIGSAFNGGYQATVDTFSGFPDEVVSAVRETPAAAAVIAPDLGPAGPELLAAVGQAVIDGWGRGLWLTAIIVALGLVGFVAWAPGRDASSDATATASLVTPPHPEIDLRAGRSEPAGVLRLRALSFDQADFDHLASAISTINNAPQNRTGLYLQITTDPGPADVVAAVLRINTADLVELARASIKADDQEPDVLLFTHDEPGPLLVQLNGVEPAATWFASRLQAGTANMIRIDADRQPVKQMVWAMSRRLDLWAERLPARASSPRTTPSEPSPPPRHG